MLKKILLLTSVISIALFFQACAQKVEPEESCNFVQNSLRQRVSWGDSTPVTLYIHSSVPSHHIPAIEAAIDEWNNAIGRHLFRVGGWINQGMAPALDGANVIYFVNAWENDRAFEQARTTVHWTGDRIYEADIRINSRDFKYFSGTQPISGHVDFQSLILHELGHVLGLAHISEPESVMVTTLPSAMLRRETQKIDIHSIRCEY